MQQIFICCQRRFIDGGKNWLRHPRTNEKIDCIRFSRLECGRLPRAVVEVRVPRGPGAVEGKGQLLVVLVLLTPHPEGGEHFLHKRSE